MLVLAGCGGTAARPGPVPSRLGGSIRLADCSDWRQSGARERYDLIEQLRILNSSPIGGSTTGPEAPGPALDDDAAYALLQRACAPPYATAFKIYKLYGRAAGFAGVSGG